VIVDVCIGKSPSRYERNSVPHGTRTGLKHNRVDTQLFCASAPLRGCSASKRMSMKVALRVREHREA